MGQLSMSKTSPIQKAVYMCQSVKYRWLLNTLPFRTLKKNAIIKL